MGQPIDKITLKGFKSIRSLEDFPLRNLNILIGANGAGKSNFVSFFRLFRAMLEDNLQTFVAKHGGANSLFFLGSRYTPDISARLEFGEYVFEFVLAPTTLSEVTIAEYHVHHPGGAKAHGSTYSMPKGVREPNLRELDDLHSLKGQIQQLLGLNVYGSVSDWIVYHFHDTSAFGPMRLPRTVRDNEYLRSEGDNIAPFLLRLRDEHRSVYDEIKDTIRLAAPFFDDFKLKPKPSNGDEILQLEWTQKGSDYPFHVSQLSDGTLRFIALATALLQPNPPATILIDEPELGLHPYALDLLAALIKKASAQTQVIVSTQSAPLLDNFEAEDVIVVQREEGASTFKRLSSGDLTEWLKDYSLGELWRKNVIEGGPTYE